MDTNPGAYLLPEGHLLQYQSAHELSPALLAALRSAEPDNIRLLSRHLGISIPVRVMEMTIRFGYPVAALLLKDFSWELSCLLTGRNDVGEIMLEMAVNQPLRAQLSTEELMVLDQMAEVFQSFKGLGDALANTVTGSQFRGHNSIPQGNPKQIPGIIPERITLEIPRNFQG